MMFRIAVNGDADGIAEVLLKSYNMESVDEARSAFMDELERGHHYIVAEENGKILGLASWTMHDLPKHGLIELNRIAVLPEFRSKGIATSLFSALLEDAKKFYESNVQKLRKVYVLTHASNKGAQSFYAHLGFFIEATLKDHYYKGEDELVYSMFL
jgi:ribosomal protein S18 acetylase RimI-like enzyme